MAVLVLGVLALAAFALRSAAGHASRARRLRAPRRRCQPLELRQRQRPGHRGRSRSRGRRRSVTTRSRVASRTCLSGSSETSSVEECSPRSRASRTIARDSGRSGSRTSSGSRCSPRPAAIGIALVADPFVMTFLGEDWEPVIVPLQILALNGIVVTFAATSGEVFQALGRPKLRVVAECMYLVLIVPALVRRRRVAWNRRCGGSRRARRTARSGSVVLRVHGAPAWRSGPGAASMPSCARPWVGL